MLRLGLVGHQALLPLLREKAMMDTAGSTVNVTNCRQQSEGEIQDSVNGNDVPKACREVSSIER